MKNKLFILCLLLVAGQFISTVSNAQKRTYAPLDESISTEKAIKSKIGKLEFPLGYPTSETAQLLDDEMLYIQAVTAYTNTVQGASLMAIRKGFAQAGANDNEFIVSPEMVDGKALLLTANMDTYYFWGNINLKDGPMVVETPPNVLGIFDDFWFRWIGDFGLAGPDRGKGGRFLIVPEGYKGNLPEGGYYIYYTKTNLVTVLGRMFLVDNSTATSEKVVSEHLKVYPYKEGGEGTSVASFLSGESPLGALTEPKTPKLVDVSGKDFNTIPPADYHHFEYINELVQNEPASALDPEIAGQLAAIGIVKGKKFNPDERTKAILDKAVKVANAYSRSVATGGSPKNNFRYYENGSWWNPLFDGGYTFMTPPPHPNDDGSMLLTESDGARKLASRNSFYYMATGCTPAMCMYLTGIGSQYLMANIDSEGNTLDGGKTYKLNLPPNIPQERFWSATLYDNQTRSMIQTNQRYPRAGSQSYPSPEAKKNDDGSITLYFGTEKPEGVDDGNYIQTLTDRGWFLMLRFYSPSKGFFDKSWQPGEIELVK